VRAVLSDIPAAIARAEAELLKPGAPFELAEAVVLGERMKVFKNRAADLREVLVRSASFDEREYMVFCSETSERRFTYREHLARVASTARVLAQRYGVGPGDRVGILAANCPEWIVTFWATISLGAVAVGMNGWWTGDELRYALADAEPTLLVADERRLARVAGRELGVPVLVVERDCEAVASEHREVALPAQPIHPDDPCIMLYTSGTTGRPKAVVHTHANLTSMIMASFFHGARMGMAYPHPGAPLPVCSLVTSPLFHVSGLHAAAIVTLAAGTKSVWTVGRFDAELALRLIERERVTGWGYTSTLLHRVLHHPRARAYDLSSLRLIGGGGSPIQERLQKLGRELMPTVQRTLSVGYGLTEASAFSTLNPGVELTLHPESSGRPVPTVELEVRDEAGRTLPEGSEGEIHVRGPMVMKEYFRKPEATAEVLLAGRWLRTGDIGRLEGGRLYLVSRKRDLILRGGENVYPVEIEQRLEQHPEVVEAAVFGVDHDELGQEVKAVVVAVSNARPSPGELTRWVAEALAYYKVPAHWEVRREPLPRNATGKVLKHELVEPRASSFIEE
jgi:long-chain acyl-CoA synthetase